MKSKTLQNSKISRLLILIILVFVSISCENEFSKDNTEFKAAPPVITTISEAKEDKVVTQGVPKNVYIIRGENLASMVSITINGYPASFNPALLTENIAFVKVPDEVPFLNQSNKIVLKNLYGSATADFAILKITSFSEATVNGKKVVNILGGDFTDTSSVTFISGTGNATSEKQATFRIVSAGEIQAEVPGGIEQAFIYVETSRGAVARSESYGLSYSIYIDQLNADWVTSEWGGTHNLAATDVALGNFSIKSFRDGWSGLTFLPPSNFSFSKYRYITFSIYGTGAPGDSVNLAINDFQSQINVVLTPNQWKKVVIPLANFYPNGGAPANITRLDFQESSGTGLAQYIFYLDDFGFLE